MDALSSRVLADEFAVVVVLDALPSAAGIATAVGGVCCSSASLVPIVLAGGL